ncbi:hypothetical protein Y032_0362g3493 [Ancylostoma ceylanicum]|uniref:Uncharacterized protein n=1 Tax=Ancylostoma ceylanicum TaxID=53326 RepID=A0A016RV90_9BILA|nr:hypothetical protein Y032_0362g3493 [Ancylostoma ceylanicum]
MCCRCTIKRSPVTPPVTVTTTKTKDLRSLRGTDFDCCFATVCKRSRRTVMTKKISEQMDSHKIKKSSTDQHRTATAPHLE